ncbi:MAG: hypothetical protein ACKOYC_09540 [Bacteroidota bacterium]
MTQEQAAFILLKLERVKEGRRKHIRSFRTRGRVFATINEVENRSCLLLSMVDQDVFCNLHPNNIYKVPNKNGTYGWTLFIFPSIPKRLYADAVQCAYENIVFLSRK